MTATPFNAAPLRCGAFITTTHWPDVRDEADVFDNSVAYAEAAERLGYDDIWLLEHHFTRYGLCNDALDMAAFLLGRTRRIDVGTAIIQVPLVHPVRLAERVAMLDHLSDGRFLCGIGRGDFPLDFEIFGQDIGRSHLAFREAWDIMSRAWTGSVSLEHSEFWKPFQQVNTLPKPRTKPRPRVYVAANSPSSVQWAAERGIPIMILFYLEDEMKKANVDLWSEVAADHGFDPSPAQHVVATVAHVADSTEQAREEIAERFVWWATEADATDQYALNPDRKKDNYQFHFDLRDEAVLRKSKSVEEEVLDKLFRLCPIGTAKHCAERLGEQLELLGVRHVVAGFEGVGGRANVITSMSRFLGEVVSRVSERVGAPMAWTEART